MSYPTLKIAFERQMPIRERWNKVAEIRKISGINVTDTSYVEKKNGYESRAIFSFNLAEGCMVGCQYTGPLHVSRVAEQIRKIKGVSKVVHSFG